MSNIINIDPAPHLKYGFVSIEWPTEKWLGLSRILDFMADTFKLSSYGKELQTMSTRFHKMLERHTKPTLVYRFNGNSGHFGIGYMEAASEIIEKGLLPTELEISILKDFWKEVDQQLTETDEFHQLVNQTYKNSTDPIEQEIYQNLQKDPWDR